MVNATRTKTRKACAKYVETIVSVLRLEGAGKRSFSEVTQPCTNRWGYYVLLYQSPKAHPPLINQNPHDAQLDFRTAQRPIARRAASEPSL